MSEEQNVNIKQRIIGALVLVSLGVIIIPMLLNGGGLLKDRVTSNKPISGDNIPVIPKKLNRVLPKIPQPIVMPEAKSITARPERALTKDSKTNKKTTPEIKTAPDIKVITETKYQKASRPVSTKINMAYTLQIASFSQKANAVALQNKLRKKKHKAYIESLMTKKGRIYRLRVGPYLKFEQISTIKNQIEKQFKLKDTVIIKY